MVCMLPTYIIEELYNSPQHTHVLYIHLRVQVIVHCMYSDTLQKLEGYFYQ